MGSMMFSPEEMGAMSGGILPPAPKNYKLPTQFPSFDHAPKIAIDLESVDHSLAADTGPGWRRGAYIVGFGVALQDHAGKTAFKEYYPLRHKAGPNLDPDRVFNGWLGTELAFYQGEITGANLLYDTDGFQYEDVTAPMAKWRDVQWAEALLDESAPSYKLETLGKKYLGIGKTTNLLKALYGPGYIERFHEIHPGHARNYVLGDCDLPLAVLEKQMEAMRKQDLLELWDVECGLLPFMLYMRKLGVRVDLNEAARLGTMFDAKRDAALTAASKLCGIRLDPDNFQKPAVREMIFQRLKIPVHHSANGKISVTDDWLESLDHPIGELLAAANKYEKAKGTFVDGYITDCAIGDRVHCEFHPLRRIKEKEGGFGGGVNGTATGRFSGTNPNLQNIPARDPVIGPLCRGMFIADEGCDWWSQDYSQIEYRFLVHYAVELKCKGAEIAQAMYIANPKTDFHEACAQLVWAQDWQAVAADFAAGKIDEAMRDKRWKKIRGPAKNLNFGLVYGMGKVLLAHSIDGGWDDVNQCPTPHALQIMDAYHAGAPFVRDLNNKCMAYADKHGFIDTILNRRRRFELWEPKKYDKGQRRTAVDYDKAVAEWGKAYIKRAMTHKALNSRLQGSAADLMKLAMVRIWESGVFDEGNDITCVLTVHDELNGSFVPSARGKAALAEVKNIMENCMKLHIPVLTSGSTGHNWAEAK